MQVDIVYTWVNHLDESWQRLHRQATKEINLPPESHKSVNNTARFQNRNEIYYSIKSVKKYAPWFNHIYIVTNCDPPEWAIEDPQISIISHKDIFPSSKDLPTFNSHAIETCLHRIPNLSEHFIYFNDDVFLAQPVDADYFFHSSDQAYIFPSNNDIPYGKNNLRPVDSGALNACHLLQKDFNFRPVKKLHHAPFPLLKSKLEEIEKLYPHEISETRRNKFRAPNDVPLATTLHAYYCLATNHGKTKTIKARYIDIGDPLFVFLTHPLSPLMKKKYTVYCLNEVTNLKYFSGIRDRYITRILSHLTT